MGEGERQPYLFIIGAPRSGTTWLQTMLAAHPEVATCQETHLFNAYLSLLHRSWEEHKASKRGIGLQAAISYQQFLELQRLYAERVLQSVRGERSLVVEKTPAHARVVNDIKSVLPEARFLHIVRDPRAVTSSLLAASKGWGARWAAASVYQNAHRWVREVEASRRGAAYGSGDYHELRYEDLHKDPASHLERIAQWAGLDASRTWCAETAQAHSIEKLREGKSDPPWGARTEPEGFYRKGATDSWKGDLSRSDIALVEDVAAPLMDSLGYQRISRGLPALRKVQIKLRRGLAWRLSKWSRLVEV